MNEGQPSQTLLRSAVRRAQHQLMDAPLILHDPIAANFVPEMSDPNLLPGFGKPDDKLATLLRALFAMRSRFAEDRLEEAAARGARQYVMIGAGLETFPWRQPDFARAMQIFSVDHPDSLIWTQRRLRSRSIAKPTNLTPVPVDLERRQLGETLSACGFDDSVTTFCSALGLLQYLTNEAMDALFRTVVSFPRGSEIVFSFVVPHEELDGDDLEIATRSVAVTGSAGEPWKSRLAAHEIAARLTAVGFSEVFHLTPEAANARYFARRTDRLRAPRWEQMIAAVV
jgi:methyltransferase (TIGR00027 family)